MLHTVGPLVIFFVGAFILIKFRKNPLIAALGLTLMFAARRTPVTRTRKEKADWS